MQGSLVPHPGWGECTPSLFLFGVAYRMDFSAKRGCKLGSSEESDTYHRLPKHPQDSLSTVETVCCPNIFQLRKKKGGVSFLFWRGSAFNEFS